LEERERRITELAESQTNRLEQVIQTFKIYIDIKRAPDIKVEPFK